MIGTTTYAIGNRGTRQDTRYMRMKVAIIRRHPYCALCGVSGPGTDLRMHHKEPWAKHPELRFKASNLTVLCKDCHQDFHHFYSKVGRKAREKRKVIQ